MITGRVVRPGASFEIIRAEDQRRLLFYGKQFDMLPSKWFSDRSCLRHQQLSWPLTIEGASRRRLLYVVKLGQNNLSLSP